MLPFSAAHCFDQDSVGRNYKVRDLIARAGITRIDSDRHLEIQIAKYVRHPKHKSPKIYYDLALVKLAQKINFNQRIQSICLPTEPVGDDDLVTVQGWGQSSEGYKGELTEINVAARSVHNLNIIICM